jgi:hypothetical protein
MAVRPYSTLVPRAVTWLWPSRFALGKIAVLDGDPGLGKSFLLVDWCARLSRGRNWPDGAAIPEPGNSLLLSAEDCPEDTIYRRLQDADADLGRVFLITEPKKEATGIRFPSGIKELDSALATSKARLLAVDPLMAFLDARVSPHSDQSVRQALGPVVRVARRRRCAVLLARHPNKRVGMRALYRGGGSIGITGLGRSAWFVAADPTDPTINVLAQTKNNLAQPQPSLAYRLRSTAQGGAIVEWLGPTLWTADDLSAGPSVTRPREKAKNFLLAALATGPRRAGEVTAAAQRVGLSATTLDRARAELGVLIQSFRVDGKRQYYWFLQSHQIPPHLTPDEDDLEKYLRPIRQDYLWAADRSDGTEGTEGIRTDDRGTTERREQEPHEEEKE